MKKIYIRGGIGVIAVMAIVSVFVFPQRAKANPIFITPTFKTATATTTVTFIPSGGTATSSFAFDSYNTGNPRPANWATLFVALSATNTTQSATLNINVQYAQDNNGQDCASASLAVQNSCDWYEDSGTNLSTFATTTKIFDVSRASQFVYAFASTTPDFRAASTATSTRAIRINTPTRYTRVVFTTPPGAPSLAYWAQWIPVKESGQ